MLTHDAGTNFDFIKFCTKAKIFDIIYYKILIETHQIIRKVEEYYVTIYLAYDNI